MTITSVLIANRGEIAVRIARTCRDLGIRSIAVYPEPDAAAQHVAAADEAVALGADPRAYLDVEAVVAAARAAKADAIHPGYGFLSENAALARACDDAGIRFIGPSPKVIEAMGSKISAKAIAVDAGVPVVPGRAEPGLSDADVAAAVADIGVPVLLKASAGGGGKGMRVVTDPGQVAEATAAARREALAAFGDDDLMVEKFVAAPRHIEVQIIGDAHGSVRPFADRECSLQRRHQKVIEEAPATSIPPGVRERMAADAVALAEAVGYVGAGTVEFIVDGADPEAYYFLEMNTRLQVEHPVTEAVTGHDLVALQIAVADGASIADLPITTTGVAVEARIYAEDPANDFLPTGGLLLRMAMPPSVRVDAGVGAGDSIGSHYDPMLAKVIAHGADRPAAYRALLQALRRSSILGLTTNLGYLTGLLADPAVLANEVPRLAQQPPVPEVALVAAAADRWLVDVAVDGWVDPWHVPSGWRLGAAAWAGWRFRSDSDTHDVELRGGAGGAIDCRIDGGVPRSVTARREAGAIVLADAAGRHRVDVAHDNGRVWLGMSGRAWSVQELSRLAADRADESGGEQAPVRSPMPGTVIAVAVADGDQVAVGDPLVTVEAMKMEHTLRAATEGVVGEVLVAVGERVALEQDLLRWEESDD
jgi:acetyl-CoA/propionyl-CoA carboxylase biotin carboxyl carrier protein